MRGRSPHPRPTHFRDAALRRLSRLNGLLIAGSVVLTGVFAEAAAATFKGKSSHKTSPGAHAKRNAHHAVHHTHTSTQIRPPATAPQPAPKSEPEVSSESSATVSPEPQAAAPEAETPAPSEAPAPVEQAPEPREVEPERSEPPVVSGGS
jgi:outer membrane biosynthesis protein TonB